MKKALLYFTTLILVIIVSSGCNQPTDSEEQTQENMVALNGRVVNSESSAPIANAVVQILDYSPEQTTISDAEGKFVFEFEVTETKEYEVAAFRESFVKDTITVLAVPGRTVADLQLALDPTGATVVNSGSAASIILESVSPSTIGVQESGSPEVAEVTFEVQDSLGIPVDIDHGVSVRFVIGSSPGGGAFLNPIVITTDNNGKAQTNLFSGDSAGVVQVLAIIDQNGQTIRSKPVTVAIHGGLPDSLHFSLAPELLNIPGYNIFGVTDGITAFVGDKYGNPVRVETPVYYTTTGGLIEGSAFTNGLGQAGVTLISSEPKPNHPTLGPGFATITGRTADENQNTIEARTIVLFSGVPRISVSPSSVNVPNQGSQGFSYIISDQNGNPLAGGTSVTVIVESGDVKIAGNKSVSIPDTQSPFWTSFNFSLIDAKPDTLLPSVVNVKISTSGPNGSFDTFVSGSSQ